nr:hypothetical protein [Candidatus Sigynarchaeota archaeon]
TGTYGFALGASSPGNYSRVFDSSVLGAVIGNQYIFELSSSKANYISLFARINVFYNPIPTALNITYNSSRLTRSGVGNTITAIYSDEIALVVNLTSYLQGFNLTGAGVSILAVVNQQTIVGSYVMASHSYVITIRVNNTIYAMAAGFTHQILVVGDASGYKGDTFSLLVDVRPIPTNMSVTINGTNLVTFLATSIFLKNTLSINVYYERFYNGYEALSQIGGQATITFLNDISLTQVTITMTPVLLDNYFTYDLPLDLSMFLSGIKDFYITASLANYQTQQLKFSLNINKVNTTVSVLVNGMTQTQLGGETITLKDTIHFSVAFLETDTLAPVLGSTVEIRYGNDTNNAMVTVLLAYNASSGTYTTGTSGLVLDLKTFFAQLKIFTITAQRSSYEVRTTSFVVNIQKILVETRLVINNTVTTNLTLATNPRESFEFRVSLIDTFTGLPFLDLSQVTVSVTPQFTGVEVVMIAETIAGNYTGEFYVLLTAPTTPGAYMMLVKVNVTNPVLQQQYQFQVFKSEFSLVVLAPPEVPLWLVYALIAGIIALAVVFILYQVRFKYPPMIRKIMDLRRSVANARDASKLRPPKVLSREENIYNHYAGIINVYRFLATKDTRFATKAPGYAPTPEGAPELEWEIPPLEGAEMPTVAPKALKKAGMKGYVPTETIKPAAMPFVTPAAVTPPQAPVAKPMAVPVPTAAPAVKPVAPAVPGAKPAIAPPIAPPTPIAAPVAKPAPVVPTPPTKPVVKAPPSLQALPKPSVAPLKAVRPTTAPKPAAAPAAEGAAGETHENLYQQLVLLEQKRYKAERSLRDLEAKHAKGLISNEEFTSYQEKLAGGLEKIKTQIADIRRKLISF